MNTHANVHDESDAEPGPRLAHIVTERLRTPKIAAFAVAIIIIGAAVVFSFSRAQIVSTPREAPASSAEEGAGSLGEEPIIEQGQKTSGDLFVHVVGAVEHPGVYEFKSVSRVVDALKAAGGATDQAALDALNLARVLTDGEQLVVPTIEQATASAAPATGNDSSVGALINLNTATAADLEELPGVGPALAKRIMDWRTSNGGFKSVDDLDAVSGIGSKVLENLRPLVRV